MVQEYKPVVQSTTPFGLALGPDLPWEDELYPGNLSQSVNGILTHFPDKKLVSASGMAGFDSSNTIVTRQVMPNFYLCGDGISEPAYGHGLMAARVAICAAHEANMITRLLLGETHI